MINIYGADAIRWFMLSDSPPERDVQWSVEGVSASFKFIQKLWKLNNEILNKKDANSSFGDIALKKAVNKTVHNVTKNLDNFQREKYKKIKKTQSESKTLLRLAS